jgi:hypothetical protein
VQCLCFFFPSCPCYPLEPNIYVDGYWVGTAPVTLQVAQGRVHSVAVDYSAYDPMWGQDGYLVDFTGDYSSYSGTTAYFTPSYAGTINARYLPW